MKTMKRFFNCVRMLIKKNIFNIQKTDIYQECERALDFEDEITSESKMKTEEYLANYTVTTRWQTL